MTEADMTPSRDQIIESVLQHHLPIEMESGSVMCMCHTKADDGAVFEGPVFHRRHVAGLILTWLDKAEAEPSFFDCQTRIRSTPPWCAHTQDWEVEVFSPGLDRWQTLRVCSPCMEDLRTRRFEIRGVLSLEGVRS